MIILTGATGFIGSNLLADLNAMGREDVILVDTLGTESKWRNIAKRRFEDIVFPTELEALLARLPGADVVYHLGANSSTTLVDGDAALMSNFRPSMALWQWCAKTRTPLIYASSAATYGGGELGFIDDESPAALDALRPLNLYGWSKHAFDKWAVTQAHSGNAPPQWCGLKFFNVYGPNENHKCDMKSLVCKNTSLVAKGETIKLFKSYKPEFADGRQARDFVYVKDCTRVMLWLSGRPGANGLFNLGTGQARTFLDLIAAVGGALRLPVKTAFIDMPSELRANYQYFTEANMGKLRAAGYDAPFSSLEAGVADYVQQYLTKPDIYR